MSKNMQLFEYDEGKQKCPACGGEIETLFHDSNKCEQCNIIWKLVWVPHSLAKPE